MTSEHNSAEGLHGALMAILAEASSTEKLALIDAHPDLAGRLKLAELTEDSRGEQSSAGLDALSDLERDRFLVLNEGYRAKFGFPFIMAVKGRSKEDILAAFEERLGNEPEAELQAALEQIGRIALLRLRDRLPSAADPRSSLA